MKQEGILKVPEQGTEAPKLKAFLDRVFDYESSYRREEDESDDLARNMVQGDQWLLRHKGDPRRVPRFTQDAREDIPKPVQNEILAAIDNEVARLAKRNSETYVDPSDAGNPASRAAAKVSADVLADHLESMRWPRKRRKAIYQDVLYGTMILKSYLEQDNLDTVRVGLVGALKCANCEPKEIPGEVIPGGFDAMGMEVPPTVGPSTTIPGCGFRCASREIPPERIPTLPPDKMGLVKRTSTFDFEKNEGGAKYETDHCLDCGAPLVKYTPDQKEAWETDAFDRPLGRDLPKGKANIEVVPKSEVFFENEGIGVDPETCLWFGQETPRSVDYVKRFYRNNVEKVKPEDSLSISERHTNVGERRAGSLGPKSVEGRAIWKNHVNVREFYHGRTVDFPMGRMIVMAGNIVLVDDDLYLPADKPGCDPIPRVKFAIARAFPKDGELVGQGFVAHAASLQNQINMAKSQVIDTRERHGVAGVLVTRGMKLTSPGWLKAFVGRVLQWEQDPQFPTATPQMLDTKLMDAGIWKEIEYNEGAIQRILGTMDAEIGNAPKGVTAYSALALLGEKASERRQQREKELIDAFEEVFQHQLLLMQRYYREPRAYKVKGSHGWERKEFLGADLSGETGVKVREQPSYDVKTAEREALTAALQIPAFQQLLTSHSALRETGKVLGVPLAVLDQNNKQQDAAQGKCSDYLREGKVPVVDENLDSHPIYFETYGNFLLTEDGQELAKAAGWESVIPVLAGWQQELQQLNAAIAMVEALNAQNAQPAMPGMPPPPPPMEIPVRPPKLLQEAILWSWNGKLQKASLPDPLTGAPPTNPVQMTPALQAFLGFRAAFEAHHMLAEGTAGQLSGPAPMPAPASGPGMEQAA